MTEITKLIKNVLQIFCLVIIDLLAFYTALFIAWLLRAAVLPVVIPDLPFFHFSYCPFHFIVVDTLRLHFFYFL